MAVATFPVFASTVDPRTSDPIGILRDQVLGQIITRTSPEFDEARRLPYITVDRRPLAIVRVATTEDVAATINVAREQGLPLTIRSGGHSLAYFSIANDAIVIDLSAMKRVTVDPVTRTARIEAGATSGDLADATQPHGLALSTGDTHSVGMGGLTTGGGIGFMVRRYGLAIDNLLSAQVVLASGEIVTASPTEHPDLFWAIRGGGGNAGIVTEFTFRLAPVGQILGGELMLPASREVLRGYLDYVASAPDDLTTIANLMHVPPFPHVPEERVGELVLSILVCWSGDLATGEAALAPLRALATPVVDTVSPIPYREIYRYTAHQAMPHAASIRMMFANDLSDDALDAALSAVEGATSPFSMVQFRGLGGAMGHVSPDATAFAHRTQPYFVAVLGLWLDAADDATVHQAWTETLWQQIRHEGSGVYVNFLENEGADRIRAAYPEETYARLSTIKRQYDPTNLFRFNQNIPPRREDDRS
jgi:hypothetical protein